MLKNSFAKLRSSNKKAYIINNWITEKNSSRCLRPAEPIKLPSAKIQIDREYTIEEFRILRADSSPGQALKLPGSSFRDRDMSPSGKENLQKKKSRE